MKQLFLLALCFIIGFTAFAKDLDKFIINGRVVMADTVGWVPLDSVRVSLVSATDASEVPFKLLLGNDSTKTVGDDGNLRMLVYAGRGNYTLTLDRDGYDVKMQEVNVKFRDQNSVWIGTQRLRKERVQELNEVEVVASQVRLVVKGDTLVYNADAFNVAEGSMLEVLIRQLDGVELSADGQITVNGRFVNSLLLNGKDFFKGDPQIALQNLPAYSVKNVKVYDKAGDDEYLTQERSSRLTRNEQDENLVMDVVLKKEFNIGLMASVEGGYGTDNRWLAKGFALGFTDKVRFSGFVNGNNIQDTQAAGSGGNWRGGIGGNGEMEVEMGGLDYMYDNDKFRIQGNAVFTYTDTDSHSQSSRTNFYDSGDLYKRSDALSRQIVRSLRSSHEIKQKWESVFLESEIDFTWNSGDGHSVNREATFNQLPIENSRIEALDSVFARPFSRKYNDIMLNRLRTASRSSSNSLTGRVELETKIKTPDMAGRVGVTAVGSYSYSDNRARNLYAQHFGGANIDPTANPINSDRFTDRGTNNYDFKLNANYRRTWAEIIGDQWQSSWTFNGNVSFTRTYNSNDEMLFIAENQVDDALPSLTEPQHAIRDLNDSYNSNQGSNDVNVRAAVSYSHQPIAPTDHGLNPSFRVDLTLNYVMNNARLEYNTLLPTHEVLKRTKHHFTPNLSFNFSSINEQRNFNARVQYSYSETDPSLNLFLSNRTNSDPLFIYENNAKGLKSSRIHRGGFSLNRYGRKRHDNFYMSANWSMTTNAVGRANEYNPNTGVTTSRPMNIQGNWGVSGNIGYSIPFGSREQFRVGTNVSGGYNHSVDFQSTHGPAIRSLVRNANVNGNVSLNYQLKNGSTFWLSGGPSWTNARSARENFQPIDAMQYSLNAGTSLILPWDMRFFTNMNMNMRRGYQDASMNDTQWLWNANLSKQLLKGAMTIRLSVTDILGQIDPVYIMVNAQGRTETWTNTMPRYGMITIQWRFNHNPGKGGKAAPKGPKPPKEPKAPKIFPRKGDKKGGGVGMPPRM